MARELKLYTGQTMPAVGLGTWHHGGKKEMADALKYAVKAGYRHIDCAYIYLNEKEMGDAIKEVIEEGVVKREDLFITSKLWGTEHAADRVEAACRATLSDLKMDYLDLYLVHWPTGFVPDKGNVPQGEGGHVLYSGVSLEETWAAMEKLVDIGLVKAIGVSNYNTQQLKRLMQMRIKPAVLQVESNPRFRNEALRKFCVKNDIVMVGYSPFGSPDLPWGKKLPHILVDPVVTDIAKRIGKSPANVVMRWQLQRGVGVIPKSIIPSELDDNLKVWDLELSPEDCAAIDKMETGERKIVPIVKLTDGTSELRDAADINFPFSFEEKEEDA